MAESLALGIAGSLDMLVVGQLAVSAMLLVGGAMLARSWLDVRSTDSGMDMNNGLAISLDLSQANYRPEDGRLFYESLLGQVSSLPGVEIASLSREVPLYLGVADNVKIDDRTVETKVVSPGHFATLRIPWLQGRDFSPGDIAGPVAVVNETMAVQCWPGRSPLGQTFRAGNSRILAFTGAVLVLVAAVASYIPARRARQVDPAITLRSD